MKTSTKMLITGVLLLAVGITFVILGAAVFDDKSWTLGWKPNFALFIPGMFLCAISLMPIFIGFSPKLAKMGAKLQNEALDNAKVEMQNVISKTATIASPAVSVIAKSIKETNPAPDIEKELKKIDELKSKRIITEEEHKRMRNKILGFDK